MKRYVIKLRRVVLWLIIASTILYIVTISNIEVKRHNRRIITINTNSSFESRNTTLLRKQDDALQLKKEDYDSDSPLDRRFKELLATYAINNVMILAVTDLGYIEMAHNLYESSFKRFNLENYLFVCSHEKAEEYLLSRNIHAISLWNDSLSTRESLYSEKGYRNKTNFKTDSVYKSLLLGYTTLLVDVDVVFLRNPLPYLLNLSREYDLIIQDGYNTLNSGKILKVIFRCKTVR